MYKVIPIIFALMLVLPLHVVMAQEITLAEKAEQNSVEIYITDENKVHVKHVVAKSSEPRQIDLIAGTRDNIQVTDIEGKEIQHAMINGDLGILFFPTNKERIVEYDLGDVMIEKEGMWAWDFRYLETTKFFFPDNIDMIFVTSQPVMLDEKKAINCHGCQMVLEYFNDDDIQYEKISWQDRQFKVPIISLIELESFEFDQPNKSISFKVNQMEKFITIVLPLELLWEPYEVYLEDQRIKTNAYIKNDTHVWVNIKPQSTGTVAIVGTTAVPEFSLFLPLILGITLITILQFRYKFILH